MRWKCINRLKRRWFFLGWRMAPKLSNINCVVTPAYVKYGGLCNERIRYTPLVPQADIITTILHSARLNECQSHARVKITIHTHFHVHTRVISTLAIYSAQKITPPPLPHILPVFTKVTTLTINFWLFCNNKRIISKIHIQFKAMSCKVFSLARIGNEKKFKILLTNI